MILRYVNTLKIEIALKYFHSFSGDQEPDSKKRRYRRKEEEDEGQIVEYDDGKSKICKVM